jgi:WhiB family redox-sensing transcriptional regulator
MMADPRKLKDPRPTASLSQFTALMNATIQATLPCNSGQEWWSEDQRLMARAAALCGACSLLVPCRAYALAANEPTGVWGGLTPAQRRQFRRRRKAA